MESRKAHSINTKQLKKYLVEQLGIETLNNEIIVEQFRFVHLLCYNFMPDSCTGYIHSAVVC